VLPEPEAAPQASEPEPENQVTEAEPLPEFESEPELSLPDDGTAQQEPETPYYSGSAPTASPASEPDRHSDLASGQDVPMSTPPLDPPTPPAAPSWPSPPSAPAAPAMRDVRLVVQAVQSAEEAALAYAREIGEARRHLSEAIAHLDQADEARALLNRLAGGFSPQASGSPATAGSGGQESAPARAYGEAPPAPERTGGSITTPSPGIAIASPTGPMTGPRGAADVHADEASADSPGTDLGTAPTPAVTPPPRPGGWGPSSGGTQ
jgi:hypothetical protein